MNRILFEKDEIRDGVATFGGVRAEHVVRILHGEVGQTIRTGELDGPVGTSEILYANGGDGNASCRVSVRVNHFEGSLMPWADLILAPPRPRVMKRLFPQLAAMGVGTIVLIGAKKVEKDFWGATLLRDENLRPLLVDGLMQAGTSIVPKVEARRNFRKFVSDELDAMFPTGERVVAHPYSATPGCGGNRDVGARLLLAVGPEGGWTEEEVATLEDRGFRRCSLGKRILKTETAVIALLAKLNREDET